MLHHEQETLFHKILHDKMSKIYIFQALLTFVKSLIGIFAPVYIYSLGYSFSEVIIFMMGISFTYLAAIPITTKIINKIGFKYSLLLSIPIYLIHITTLNFIELNTLIFHLAWFSYGTHMAIFWPAMHSEIAVNSDKKHSGNQIGTLQIIITIVSALAPLIGGFYLEFISFTSLLILALIITTIGAIPLMFAEDLKIKNPKYNYSDYIRLYKTPKFKTPLKAFIAEGIESFLNLGFWPVLLYTLLSNNFLTLGTLFSFVSIISIFLVVYFKKYIDKHPKKTILTKTIKLKSFGWILRIIVLSVSGILVYLVETITKLTNSIFGITYMSIFYNNAKTVNPMDYVILRELGIHSTKIILGTFLLIALEIFGPTKEVFSGLLATGIVSAIYLGKLREEL